MPKDEGFSDEVKDIVRQRARGRCEIGCGRPGSHFHHRKLRRSKDHRVVNCLLLCLWCHDMVHKERPTSNDNGWIVSQYAAPEEQMVLLAGRWYFLGEDGSKKEWAA